MESCFYEINEDKVKCLLCPHFCLLKKDEIGKCQRRISDGISIFDSNYGHLTHVAIDPIEKKPLRHYLSGTKTLSIGSWGCSLFCEFCENFKISQKIDVKKTKYFSPQNVIDIAIEKHCKSVCMTYNEPTISFEYLMDIAECCHSSDLKFILKTNAYLNEEPWAEVCKVTDAMNIDLKAGNRESFMAITGSFQYVTRDRIKEAYDNGVHIEISIPLYYYDDVLDKEINSIGEFLNSIDTNIPCHLLKIYPSYKFNNFVFGIDNLNKAKNILLNYMKNIYEVI